MAKNKTNENIFEQDERKKRNRLVAGLVSAAVLLGGATTSVLVFDPFGIVDNENANVVNEDNSGGGPSAIDDSDNNPPIDKKAMQELLDEVRKDGSGIVVEDESWAQGNKPVVTEEWQEKVPESLDEEAVKEGISSKYISGNTNTFQHLIDDYAKTGNEEPQWAQPSDMPSSVIVPFQMLPSEEGGFTADPNKAYNDDGSLNPLYTMWTQELFTTQVGYHLEKLLNPEFGGWSTYQFPDDGGSGKFNINNMRDSFTDSWLEKFDAANSAGKASTVMPVLADWNGDNFGRDDLLDTVSVRWYGNVTGYTYDFDYNQETQRYSVNAKYDVSYTAWTKDQKKLQRDGVLEVKLIANGTDENNSSDYKVLIDQATLTLEETK